MPSRWDIPRPIWMILLSWGLAVLVISVLLFAWFSRTQRSAETGRCPEPGAASTWQR